MLTPLSPKTHLYLATKVAHRLTQYSINIPSSKSTLADTRIAGQLPLSNGGFLSIETPNSTSHCMSSRGKDISTNLHSTMLLMHKYILFLFGFSFLYSIHLLILSIPLLLLKFCFNPTYLYDCLYYSSSLLVYDDYDAEDPREAPIRGWQDLFDLE